MEIVVAGASCVYGQGCSDRPRNQGHNHYCKQVIVPLMDNFFKNHNE